ncbi:MAG: hypothetical protein WAN75_51630, partial [Xanthobacteraceae bacterium]
TGGYLEVRDNRLIDGTDILKDIAFLKFDGDATTIPAPGRELQTVTDASARSWITKATQGHRFMFADTCHAGGAYNARLLRSTIQVRANERTAVILGGGVDQSQRYG